MALLVAAVTLVASRVALRGVPPVSSEPRTSCAAVTTSAPASSSRPPGVEAPVDVGTWSEAARPAIIPGRFGTLDASAYDRDPGTTLGHAPAVTGPFVERRISGPETTTYVHVPDAEALADSTQLIVRGRTLAFSRPYFNATTGEFWLNELVGVRGGVSAAEGLQRDVLFRVDEVLGTTLPGGFEPGAVRFTVQAGQVVVDVPTDVPYADLDHVLPAGRYLIRERPAADLVIGEEVVLFLRYGGWLGLAGDGGGEARTLAPAHPLYYAFRVDGDRAVNLWAAAGKAWNRPIENLREIARRLVPRPDQSLPDARIHPARPTHDAAERPLPSPTPCSPLAVIDYWSRYSSLDALLRDADLVVVARLTARATEEPAFSDSVVRLINDVLVEQVVAGDASAGSLLPVKRLAAGDPACGLVLDGIDPLVIDRPYLLALRRGGDAFVLLEEPRPLAEVRDGRLVSERWPELMGLTVREARQLLVTATDSADRGGSSG